MRTSARAGIALLAALALLLPSYASAQTTAAPDVPTVSVTASATAEVRHDRAHAWMRAEAEAADPATAARQVNAAAARALARIKGVAAMTVTTSGYSTQPIVEKGRTVRWRVSETLALESADFEALATLVTRVQAEDGLLLGGLGFSLSRAARERAEHDLVREAIRTWQMRATEAATALGFAGARPAHVNVQTGEGPRPYPMARMASAMAAESAPVAIEGGFANVTVTVTGDARLEGAQASAR